MPGTTRASSSKMRWLYLLCAVVIFLVLGVLYAWSLMAEPFEMHFGWSRSDTSGVFTFCMASFSIGNLAGGWVAGKRSIQCNLTISALLLLAGFLGSAFAVQIWHLSVFYGILGGFGIGFSYGPVISVIMKWFPDRPGAASGILLVAFGVSTLVVGSIVTYLFAAYGIRKALSIMAFLFAGTLLLASLPIKHPLAEMAPQSGPSAKSAHPHISDVPTSQVVKSPIQWLFWLWQTFGAAAGYAMIAHAAPTVTSLGGSAATAFVAASVLAVSNGASRALWGILSDHISLRTIRIVNMILYSAGCLLCIAAIQTVNITTIIVGFLVIGASYGGIVAHAPVFYRSYFGGRHFSSNYSLFFLTGAFSAVIGPVIMAAAFEKSGYLFAYAVQLAFVLCASIIVLFMQKPEVYCKARRASTGDSHGDIPA